MMHQPIDIEINSEDVAEDNAFIDKPFFIWLMFNAEDCAVFHTNLVRYLLGKDFDIKTGKNYLHGAFKDTRQGSINAMRWTHEHYWRIRLKKWHHQLHEWQLPFFLMAIPQKPEPQPQDEGPYAYEVYEIGGKRIWPTLN